MKKMCSESVSGYDIMCVYAHLLIIFFNFNVLLFLLYFLPMISPNGGDNLENC